MEAVVATFSGRNPREFQDIMLAAPVIRIGTENDERFGIDTAKFWMLAIEATEEAIELGDGTDRKRRRHGC